jgi:hypothetical protein
MRRNVGIGVATVMVALAIAMPLVRPQPARASIGGLICGVVGSIGPGWVGKACGVVANPGKVVGVVKKVLGGKPGQALKLLLGGGGGSALSRGIGIAAIVAWAVGGAHFVLSETAKLIGESTSPELTAGWFSSVYWRVAGVGALLTLPFLIAAAIQALLRSDGGLLARAVFGYLPLALIATGIAAPAAMMLLRITDWMGDSVAGAAGNQGAHFLVESGVAIGALGVVVGSPFVTFLVALLTAAGGLVLWLELLIRTAAVYVVVLMLPLIFSAMVWPARRVWAMRAVELLVALIVAKFAIVSVLALAAAAFGHGGGSLIVRSLAGLVLVTLGAFAPWVLLRLLPLAEVASAAAGHVREHTQSRLSGDAALASQGAATVSDNVAGLLARMQRLHVDTGGSTDGLTNVEVLHPSSELPRPMVETRPGDRSSPPRSTIGTAAITTSPASEPAEAQRSASVSRNAAAAATPDGEHATDVAGPAVVDPPATQPQASRDSADRRAEADEPVGPPSGPELPEVDDEPPAKLPPTQSDEEVSS